MIGRGGRWIGVAGGLVALAGCSGSDSAGGEEFGTSTATTGVTSLDSGSTSGAETTITTTMSGGETTATTTGVDESTSASSAEGSSSGGPTGCQDDLECQEPGLGVCDPMTGECEACLVDADCPMGLTCNADNLCDGCDGDEDCPIGSTCVGGVCQPGGCSDDQPCPAPFSCCNGSCKDLSNDVENCGTCGEACPVPDEGTPACTDFMCGLGACNVGFNDCDVNATNGCEFAGDCSCTPGAMQACYTGPMGTENVGICVGGMQTCNMFGTAWGACTDEVTPDAEICGNGVDEDCNAIVDDDPDLDGDGFTACGADCCDQAGPNCAMPGLVNPGAFEVDGNMVDDDCDGMVDNPLPSCDAGLASNSANPEDYARAIDLCQFTTLNPPDPADETWGVITGSSALVLASGAGNPAANSRSLRDGFGNNITNQFGARLAVLSTGHAADNAGDVNPNFATFQQGQQMGTSSSFPQPWFMLNGNTIPNVPGCPDPLAGTAQNPVMLEIDIRVPTNANSFSVNMYFFSAEYPEWVCTPYNDFFVTLVTSSDPGNPGDGNIAIYDDGNQTYPVGVNIIYAANGLFTACQNGAIGQCGGGGNYNGCVGTNELSGTGFDIAGATADSCGFSGMHGGGTGWLLMSGNVTPGEIMTIRFAVWDTSDQIFDSLVLLDNWQWSVQASEPGVIPN